jgi:type II secretory pathway component PulM
MKISPREKKFLIIGGAVCLVGLIAYLAVTVMPSRDVIARELEGKKRTLLRQREMVGREAFYKSRAESYRQRLKQDYTRFLPGETPSIAAAELQRVLKELADPTGVEIIRRDIQKEQKLQDNIYKVSVRIETNCVPDQLVQFLTAVQNYSKYLAVEELAITSFKIQKRWEIRPSITVAGLILAPEAKPAEKSAGAK